MNSIALDKLGGAIKMVVNMLTRDGKPVRIEAAGALLAAFGDVTTQHRVSEQDAEKRITSLEKALRPFAKIAKHFDGNLVTDKIMDESRGTLTIGHLRQAAAAMKKCRALPDPEQEMRSALEFVLAYENDDLVAIAEIQQAFDQQEAIMDTQEFARCYVARKVRAALLAAFGDVTTQHRVTKHASIDSNEFLELLCRYSAAQGCESAKAYKDLVEYIDSRIPASTGEKA